jgi:hypothetical protein
MLLPMAHLEGRKLHGFHYDWQRNAKVAPRVSVTVWLLYTFTVLVEGASALGGSTRRLLGQSAVWCLTQAPIIRWRITHEEFLLVAEYYYDHQT